MKLLSPTPNKRLNEAIGFLLLSLGLVLLLSLVSFHVQDPSWDTASGTRPLNLVGYPGSYLSDLLFQAFGAAAFVFPLFCFALAWRWIRSEEIDSGTAKSIGVALLALSLGAAFSFLPWRLFGGTIWMGGMLGSALASFLLDTLNVAGAPLAILSAFIVSVYLVSSFSMARLADWFAGPLAWWDRFWMRRADSWRLWTERVNARHQAKSAALARRHSKTVGQMPLGSSRIPPAARTADVAPNPEPFDEPLEQQEAPAEFSTIEEIPICPLEELEPESPRPTVAELRPFLITPAPEPPPGTLELPATDLLNEAPGRSAYDEQELKDTAVRIKAKFEEFNVLGSVVQINPGPVVTTFEFKPEAGIKYSRITNLTEDLCLGLQAESILIERIPGKPTVGIEVPNTRREVISLRQMLESEEFAASHSHLTIPLGKDINGRIRVAALEQMPARATLGPGRPLAQAPSEAQTVISSR